MASAVKGGDGNSLRVVLLGKTGNGKSTLGNALLRTQGFQVGHGLNSETIKCAWIKATRTDVTLAVTDTPGLCDTYMREEDVYKELAKSVVVNKPGPNVILFVLRAERRFTTEEYKAYQTIKELFSDEINKYLILVFNGIDQLGAKTLAEQRVALKNTIHQMLNPQPRPRKLPPNPQAFLDMMEEAGGRYIGLNNRSTPEELEAQIQDLLRMMQDLVRKNGGAIYRTELTEKINKKAAELLQKEADAATQVPQNKDDDFSKRVIDEDVPTGFFASIGKMVKDAFKTIKRQFEELCTVM